MLMLLYNRVLPDFDVQRSDVVQASVIKEDT